MRKYTMNICLITGIISLVLATATAIVMFLKEVDNLWIILIISAVMVAIACIVCAMIEIKEINKEAKTKDSSEVLCEAYKEIFKK